MKPVIATHDLDKASANLHKMAEFFSARRQWRAPDSEVVEQLWRAVLGLGEMVQDLVQMHQVPVSRPGDSAASALPPDEFDPARVQRFVAYMGQVTAWFEAHRSADLDSGAHESLARVFSALVSLRQSLDEIASGSAPKPQKASEPPAPEPPPEPLPPPPENAPDRLVLFDCDETPMLQTFQNQVELSDLAREEIRNFLQAWGILPGRYQLQKFEEKVQRWIESTPDGQMLVLKVGGLSGRREPYPSYVQRKVGEALTSAD